MLRFLPIAFVPAILVSALASGPALAQASAAPDLLRRALSKPAAPDLYAYEFEDVSTGDRNRTVRGRVDPSRGKGDRVEITFFSESGGKEDDKPTDVTKVDERYERNADGDIFCDGLSDPDVTRVVDKGAGPAGRLFSFIPKAPKDAEGEMKAIMKKVSAEAVVDEATATLKTFTAKLTKPHSVMMVAQVKAMNLTAQCAPAPNGRAYATRREISVSGSGLGRNFASTTVQTISNLRPTG